MALNYQSHEDDARSISDSNNKLERLQIPNDLTGKSFLDIGCNEGFFCDVAAQRGARRVVGIDFYAPSLDYARAHYAHPVIEYRHQKWDKLPDESFDLILWASAMHYELDPAHVLGDIARVLNPGGLFILECGVPDGGGFEMVLVQRQNDSRLYPTVELLTTRLLDPFAFRQLPGSKTEAVDPVPRYVYHCQRRQPTIMLFRGESSQGKSSAARLFGKDATKVISLDLFLYRISVGQFHHGDLQAFIKAKFNANDLTSLYDAIDAEGLTNEYARLLACSIASSDVTVVIDGYMTDRQADELHLVLRERAIIWDAQRLVQKH